MRFRILPLMLVLAMFTGTVAAQQPDAADLSYRRAVQLLEAGKLAEAAREFERVLELAERALGPDDPRLAVDLNNLGEVYRRQGRLERAAELLRRAIRLDEAAGGRSPALATSLNNLGLVLRAQGRLDAAADLYHRALDLLEGTLGPDHPDTARALNNLAQLELERGDPASALPLQERAAKIARASLGPSHATTRAIEAALVRTRAAASGRPAPSPPASKARPKTSPPGRPLVTPPPAIAARTAPPPAATATSPPVRPPPVAGAKGTPATPTAAPVRGGFRLHLASTTAPERIAGEWTRLKAAHPRLADLELLPPERVQIPGRGVFWRLVAGRFASREAAAAVCVPLKAEGRWCAVLGP